MKQKPADMDGPAWSSETHCLALDGIRGLAILMVTLYRLFKELDPASHSVIALVQKVSLVGGRGVDLFFVLSGFLITGILIRSKSQSNYFRNFIIRRSLRIFPLYFLSLVIGLWLIPKQLGGPLFEMARKEQFYLWTYMSNVRVSWLNEWCFGPFDHFWSLAVEEHFYLVWPAVVFFLATKRLGWFCIFTVVGVAIARAVAETVPSLDVAVDVLTVFRIDALCIGALLAVLMHSSGTHDRIRRGAPIAAAIVLVTLIAIGLFGSRAFGIPALLVRILFMACMAIVLLSPKRSMLVRGSENAVLRFLGKYSYGMYVVQLPMVVLLPFATLAGYWQMHPIADGLIYVVIMFGLITLTAYLSYHLFESHFLKLKIGFQSAGASRELDAQRV
jgi:peptidoglycan/LPS O-acetylase OafA/YrhL